jgi:hypothetical protein
MRREPGGAPVAGRTVSGVRDKGRYAVREKREVPADNPIT